MKKGGCEDSDVILGKVKNPESHNGCLRSEFIITGKVQKIGFRGMIRDLAEDFNLFGKVENIECKNEVKITCEGKKDDIDNFEEYLYVLKRESEERQKRKKKLEEELKEINNKKKKFEIDFKKLSELSPDACDELLYLLEEKKREIRKKKELNALCIPFFRIDDINRKDLSYIGNFYDTSFSTDMTKTDELLDFGMHGLVELRRDNLYNPNFEEMNLNFDILNLKYGKIYKSLEEGVSIKGVEDIATAFGKALEEHDKRIIELLKSKK